jgi:chemotaxis protein CheX
MTAPDLATIVEDSVVTMLGLSLGALVDRDETADGCQLGASVQFTGDWEGAIAVGCDAAFGNEIAAAMFAMGSDEVTDDEITDALGELANMIAGNVKPLLPGAASLSLPTVFSGSEVRLGIPGAKVWLAIAYNRNRSDVFIRIYQRTG